MPSLVGRKNLAFLLRGASVWVTSENTLWGDTGFWYLLLARPRVCMGVGTGALVYILGDIMLAVSRQRGCPLQREEGGLHSVLCLSTRAGVEH